jgi:hypothetical protein
VPNRKAIRLDGFLCDSQSLASLKLPLIVDAMKRMDQGFSTSRPGQNLEG